MRIKDGNILKNYPTIYCPQEETFSQYFGIIINFYLINYILRFISQVMNSAYDTDDDIWTFVHTRFHQYQYNINEKHVMSQNQLIDFAVQYNKTKQQRFRVAEADIVLEYFHAKVPVWLQKKDVHDFLKKLDDAKMKSIYEEDKRKQEMKKMKQTRSQKVRLMYQLAVDYFFKKYDNDVSGTLDIGQFTRFVNQLKVKLQPADTSIWSEQQVRSSVKQYDPNFKGTLNRQDVLSFLKRATQTAFPLQPIETEQSKEIMDEQIRFLADFLFKKYDTDHSGFLDLKQLTNFSNQWRMRNGKKEKQQSEIASQLKKLNTQFPQKANKDQFIELLKIQILEVNDHKGKQGKTDCNIF